MVLIRISPMTSDVEQFFLYARWPFVCLENVCPAIRPFSSRAVYFCAVELCGLLTLGPEPVWDARAADRPLRAAGRPRGPSTVPSPGRGFGSTQPHTFLLLSPVLWGHSNRIAKTNVTELFTCVLCWESYDRFQVRV